MTVLTPSARQGKRQGELLAGKYLLEDLLGVGGMGEVYRATNIALGRKVAVKLLSPDFAKSEDDVNRFLREARAAAAVRHTNVVDVLDILRDDEGTPFIVQELLAGEDLDGYLKARNGRIGPDETMELMIPVADAVAAAHAQKVVHRDLKPANIFLARDRNKIVPKVLDFGAALFPTIAERSAREARMLIGTPHYMAPEQIIDKTAVDARSDVWALGVILYEMMVGETPFEAESASAVLTKVKSASIPALRARVKEAPVELEQIVAKCMNRDRASRFAEAAEVRDALENLRKKRKGAPQSANLSTLDDVVAPVPRPPPSLPRPSVKSAPRIPSLDKLDVPTPLEPTAMDAPRATSGRNLLTLSAPDDEISSHSYRKEGSLDLDIPLPMGLPPPASAERPIPLSSRVDPSGVRDKIDDSPQSLDLSPFSPEEEPLGNENAPSSLPPVLFSSSAVQKKPSGFDIPPPAAVPTEMRDDPSGLGALPLEKARPVGPSAVKPDDYAKRIVAQTWGRGDTIRLGAMVALPALALYIIAGLVPPVSQPLRHAMLGDSSLASGVVAVAALIATAGLFFRAALRERTKLAWVAAIAALLFGIAMIITTFGASEAVESGAPLSTTSLATLVGPLFPFILSLDWLTKARDFFLDPYSRSEARRSMAISALFLFLTLALSPVGAVRAPPHPMHALQGMVK